MNRRVLILGMGGQFGSMAARAFRAAGWNVDRYHRGTDMAVAARGVRWIINALNPPNYHDWAHQIPQITNQVLAAARDSGASIMMPANLYVFGREPGPWRADTPHHPCSRKGRIRAEMEERYRDHATEGRSVVFLRAGDFVNPESPDTILNRVMLKDVRKGRITAMGKPEARRVYADLGDLTQIAVALADTADSLPGLLDLCYPGTRFSLREMADELAGQLGREIAIKQFPWTALLLASPVWELARELREMRYLYDMDHAVDGSGFEALFPGFEPKTLQRMVFEHLYMRGMKVVPDQGAKMSTQTSL